MAKMSDEDRMATYKSAISEGTVVRLRSGGPVMTAEQWLVNDCVSVVWFDDKQSKRDNFHPFALVVI